MLLGFVMVAAWGAVERQGEAAARTLAFFFVLRRAMSSFSTLQKLPARWLTLREHLSAVERMLRLEQDERVPGGQRQLPGIRDGIRVQGLSFAYPGGEPVLRDVDLEIPRGRLTAIVGANGSGKSTLLKLLLRLYDCPEASIFVDAVDIRELDLAALRTRTAWADSAPLLFRDTVRANLVYGLDRVDAQRLGDAIEGAGLAGVIDALPRGLDTAIGAGERGLSAGERQRLGIARLLLREADLLLLDEALASLDPVAEREVLSQLARTAANRCVVVVTHRPEALPAGSWIITLEGGRVALQGTSSGQRPRPARAEAAAVEGPVDGPRESAARAAG